MPGTKDARLVEASPNPTAMRWKVSSTEDRVPLTLRGKEKGRDSLLPQCAIVLAAQAPTCDVPTL